MRIDTMNSIKVGSLGQALAIESGEKVTTGVEAGAAVQFAESLGEEASAVTQTDLDTPIPSETDVSLSERLQSVGDKLENNAFQVGGRSLLFDVYAVMALIQSAQQKLRDAQRELRKTENQAIQDSILKQAEAQRSAATTQFWAGIGMSAGAVLVSLGAVWLSNSSQKSLQTDFENAAGKDVCTKELNLLNGMDDAELAKQNVSDIKSKILEGGQDPEILNTVDKEFESLIGPQGQEMPDAKTATAEKPGSEKLIDSKDAEDDVANSQFDEADSIKNGEVEGESQVQENNDLKVEVEKVEVEKVEDEKVEVLENKAQEVEEEAESKSVVHEEKIDVEKGDWSKTRIGKFNAIKKDAKHPLDKNSLKNVNPKDDVNPKENVNPAGVNPKDNVNPAGVNPKDNVNPVENVKTEENVKAENAEKKEGEAGKDDAGVNDAETDNQKKTDKQPSKTIEEYVNICKDEYEKACKKARGEAISADADIKWIDKTSNALSEKTKFQLKAAGDKYLYARAKQIEQMATAPKATDQSMTEDVTKQKESLNDKIMAAETFGANHAATGGKSFARIALLTMAGQALMNTAMNFAQMIGERKRADATKVQALQKQEEESLDQFRDLFANSQNVIQEALKLFQQVTEKESQSVEVILQGIKA